MGSCQLKVDLRGEEEQSLHWIRRDDSVTRTRVVSKVGGYGGQQTRVSQLVEQIGGQDRVGAGVRLVIGVDQGRYDVEKACYVLLFTLLLQQQLQRNAPDGKLTQLMDGNLTTAV